MATKTDVPGTGEPIKLIPSGEPENVLRTDDPPAAQFEAMAETGADQGTEVTDLATTDEQAVGLVKVYEANPEFDASEMTLTRLRLAQGLTEEVQSGDAKPGQWVMTGYEAYDEVVVIPVMFNRSRIRRKSKDDRSILCQSGDSKFGVGDPGMECAKCPFARWTPDPAQPDKNLPPQCPIIYSYGLWSVTHGALCEVSFSRTTEAVAKFINTLISARGLGRFAIKLRGKSETRGNGPQKRVFAVALASIAKPTEVTPEDFENAGVMLESTATA